MKKLIPVLIALFISVTISAQSKEEKIAKKRTEELKKAITLSPEESEKIYTLLFTKEKQVSALRVKFKKEPKNIKAGIKQLNIATNRKIKDLIGKEKMNKSNAYFKAKRESAKKKA